MFPSKSFCLSGAMQFSPQYWQTTYATVPCALCFDTSTTRETNMLRTAGLAVAGVLYASAAFAVSPSDFVTDAIKGDNSEIMLGRYAAEHGASAKIKNFGQTLVADHTKAKKQMVSIAAKVGVSPPSMATVEADAERVKLMALSGDSFDREFAQYMVKDHESDIAKFKEE